MVKRKTTKRRHYPKKQEDNIFTGTKKLADTAIKAYKIGGMPLVLVIVGLIGFVFAILLKSMMDTVTFIAIILVCILLFSVGVFIYLKEKKIV